MDARDELIALGSRSTPTITVDGQPFIGFSPQKLSAALSD
jgi:glutaredoxin